MANKYPTNTRPQMCGFSNIKALVGGYLWPSGRKYPPAKPLQNIMNWGNCAGICSYFQEKWPSFGQPIVDIIRPPRARAQLMLHR